jgi:magnesium transporter
MTEAIKTNTFKNFEWIDLNNPNQELVKSVAEGNQFDPIFMTDSLQHGHLPKIEHLQDYTFIILRAYSAGENEALTTVEKLSNKIAFFIKKNKLITVHRVEFGFLEHLGNGYETPMELVLDIANEMVNTFIPPMETQSDQMDQIENLIFLQNVNSISLENLYYQKTKARISKKLLVISQNVIGQMEVEEGLKPKHQDIKDTLINSILLYDEINEDANNLLNTYLTVTARKSNETMKLLTIFSAFFLPLTFIVGVYGMNFEYMPELQYKNGYFLSLGFMAIVSVIIYIWFKKKEIL